MQYLISVIADGTEVDGPEVMAAIDVFNERLQAKGHWVYANGLAAPSTATVIDGTSPASGSSRLPTSMWRSSSPPRDRSTAIGLTANTAEIAYLTRRREQLQ